MRSLSRKRNDPTARADSTNTFSDLSTKKPQTGGQFQDPAFEAWYGRWQNRRSQDGQPITSAYALMQWVNPAVIPRSHRVEEALSAAEERGDMSVLHRLLAALGSPYEIKPARAEYRDPPADECGYRTFCGT